MAQKRIIDRYAVVRTYGMKELLHLFNRVWIGGNGSGVWIAFASRLWIGTLHFDLQPHTDIIPSECGIYRRLVAMDVHSEAIHWF